MSNPWFRWHRKINDPAYIERLAPRPFSGKRASEGLEMLEKAGRDQGLRKLRKAAISWKLGDIAVWGNF